MDDIHENDCLCPCHCRHKDRDASEVKDLVTRLNKIEGQVKGIRRMVERGDYCTDIINQASAVSAAIGSFNRLLISNHIKTCVKDDIIAGKDETIDDLLKTLTRLMR